MLITSGPIMTNMFLRYIEDDGSFIALQKGYVSYTTHLLHSNLQLEDLDTDRLTPLHPLELQGIDEGLYLTCGYILIKLCMSHSGFTRKLLLWKSEWTNA